MYTRMTAPGGRLILVEIDSRTWGTNAFLLQKAGVDPEGNLLQEGTQLVAHLAIRSETEEIIGARRYETSPG